MSPPKNCAVCGDKALGYNFNAVTCESCKAFFRRNALAKKQFTCPFNQNCDITVVTRRFCQKCRLKKCLDIGMKSENIMSEEDKLIKRRKIENNRAKRRMMEHTGGDGASDPDDSKAQADSSSNLELYSGSQDSQSCGSVESGGANGCVAGRSSSEINPLLMTADKIVEQIVSDPDRASQAINKLMRTQKEAISVMEKVIGSQKDALRLVSHLIDYPGDALKIISKFMNSPFNALTVFTKFMSSPTDGVEIISKIVDSPADVVEFMQNLMHSPEDAIDIMNKFMNTPAEALRIVNRILSGGTNTAQLTDRKPLLDKASGAPEPEQNGKPASERVDTVIQSMLGSGSPSPVHTSASSPHDLQYHSPSSNPMGSEQPSTSSSHPLPDIANSPDFDLKTFMQTNYNDEPSLDSDFSINSIESVLSEVIRIEYQAFNSIQAASRIKEEMSYMGGQSYSGCNPNSSNNQQQQLPQQPICAPSSMHMDRELNEAEQMKLRELRLASEALYDPVDEDLSALMMGDDRIKPDDTRHNPKLLQLINLTAVAIKRLIKMAKKISAFRDMCQEDQVALLKGGCTEMMIMRSAMIYDDDRNAWKVPHTKENMGNIRTDLLKIADGNIYEEHQKFITTFDEKWRMDENIILIMCAIVLFTSARSRVIHKDVIRLEQNSYYYLLRRYLESVYSGCEAKNAFIKLIQKISDVERLNKFIINVYLNVNPSQVEPLLREIFDLKNH
ncbi:nuclear hormone receptor HR96 [Drosophila guanche]|uniref:Blast:Nuclear hormone receptor HR96 n=1 Tax=Drosophila guanche TaxID=7266 RepID=A0A3B0JJ44_DROGU|nr:nuclear hormone receptor HR96 [Drosophila guanche]SPP80352.1 blast:Nuclear hormone receptor HR96 [Drosophila guanche]